MKTFGGITLAALAVAAFAAGRWAGAGQTSAEPTGDASTSGASGSGQAVGAASDTWEAGVKELVEAPPAGRGAEWVARLLDGDVDGVAAELEAIEDEAARTDACLEAIAAMDSAAIRTLVETYFGGEDTEVAEAWVDTVDEVAAFAFMQRWAEVDAAGLLAYGKGRWEAAGSPGDDESMSAWFAFGAALFVAEIDPDRAIALGEAIGGDMGQEVKLMSIELLAKADPKRALELALAEEGVLDNFGGMLGFAGPRVGEALPVAMAIEDEELRSEVLESLLEPMFLADPLATFEAVLVWPDADEAEELTVDLIEAWAGRDPAAALAAADRVPDGLREEARYSAFIGWATREPRVAPSAAQAELGDEDMAALAVHAAAAMPPNEALMFANVLSPAGRTALLGNYLAEDAPAALQWIAGGADDEIPERDSLARRAGLQLGADGADAVREAMALLAGAEGDAEGNLPARLLLGALPALGYNSPAEAQALIASAPADRRTELSNALAQGWVERDPEAAVAFVRAEGDADGAAATWGRWALFDPGAAHASILAAEAGDPAALAEAVERSRLAVAWANRDPEAAAHAMLDLPATDAAAGEQLAVVMGNWATYDPVAASQFAASQLAPGEVRDAAVKALSEGLERTDPEAAAAWRATIGER